ncbi:MAG: hypothetical protein OXC99_03090 [Chloroflexi bacterium]|nr:hypothetical protein [Chloroflexota bacterium]
MTLSGFAVSPAKIELRWTTNFDDVERFEVFRDDVLIATPSLEDRSYSDADLSPNTRYTYKLEVQRSNGAELSAELSKATLAHAPRVARQMATHGTGLQLPIIDEVNPAYTEYQVRLQAFRGGVASTSEWSSSKCRTLEGLQPGTVYSVTVEVRNLDGVTERAIDFFAEDGGPEILRGRTAHAWGHAGTQDSWVQARIRDTAGAHGLTQAAEDWMNNDILIERKRGEIRFRSSHNGHIEMGHSFIGHLMADVMRAYWAYWAYWDGFSEPCDRMNLYTFRRDVAQFALDFRDLDRAGTGHRLEPWRPYYNLIRAILANHDVGDEDYWEVLDRGEYGKFGGLWWEMEALIPGFNPHHPSLIPPRIRKYFVGFMSDGGGTTWDEELDWYIRLEDEDRGLWSPFVTHAILHNSPRAPNYIARTRIPEPLRTTLRDVERQLLVDFINTMEDHIPWGWWEDSPGGWTLYLEIHLHRLPLYAAGLGATQGIELGPSNLDAVVEALLLLRDYHCRLGELGCSYDHGTNVDAARNQVHASISGIEPLSDRQREFLLAMIELRR